MFFFYSLVYFVSCVLWLQFAEVNAFIFFVWNACQLLPISLFHPTKTPTLIAIHLQQGHIKIWLWLWLTINGFQYYLWNFYLLRNDLPSLNHKMAHKCWLDIFFFFVCLFSIYVKFRWMNIIITLCAGCMDIFTFMLKASNGNLRYACHFSFWFSSPDSACGLFNSVPVAQTKTEYFNKSKKLNTTTKRRSAIDERGDNKKITNFPSKKHLGAHRIGRTTDFVFVSFNNLFVFLCSFSRLSWK